MEDMDKTVKTKKRSERPQRKTLRPKIYLTILLVAWCFVAMLGGQLLVGTICSLILGERLNQPFWMLIYYIIVYAFTISLILFIPPWIVRIYQKHHQQQATARGDQLAQTLAVTPNEMGVDQLPTLTDVGLAPIGYIAYILCSTALTALMSLFTWFNAQETQDVGFSYFLTTGDRICAIIATVFIAPIAEELIMRGWLYGKLRNQWRAPVAIILTSLVFAILHGQWNVGVAVFALSVILCGLREVTGTIWSGMLLHMLSNGIAFYLLYVAI